MEESKLASAIAEGIVKGQSAHMEKLFGVLQESANRSFGFFIEVKSEEISRMLRDRAHELRADVSRMRPIIADVARAQAAARGARQVHGLMDETTALENLDGVEKDASRLEFMAAHVVAGSYRIMPHDLSAMLLEGHQGLAAVRRCYTGGR